MQNDRKVKYAMRGRIVREEKKKYYARRAHGLQRGCEWRVWSGI